MMKRLTLLAGLCAVCQLAWSPQQVEAHGWRGRSDCGSYYSGYSYCSPQSYYQAYSNYAPCYNNYGSYYGTSGYGAYSNYGTVPYGVYPQYVSPQYGDFGPCWNGAGGGSLLGLLGATTMAGANLTGALVQPSYLSMPVGVGYGQSGYLQIPVGGPGGRASYLQIPVNTGYGPASYLQIELGRNSNSTVPGTPTPGPTPQPLGSASEVNIPIARRFTNEIHQTPTDELPPVVPTVSGRDANTIVATSLDATTATDKLATDKRSAGNPTASQAKIQFVSWPKSTVATQTSPQATAMLRTKDTSFSLGDADTSGPNLSEADQELASSEQTVPVPGRESPPWIAK